MWGRQLYHLIQKQLLNSRWEHDTSFANNGKLITDINIQFEYLNKISKKVLMEIIFVVDMLQIII